MVFLRKKLTKLNDQFDKYKGEVGSMESALSKYISFEFGIEHQQSDGFVVLNVETSNVAPLIWCISEIESSGSLTEDSHKAMCI